MRSWYDSGKVHIPPEMLVRFLQELHQLSANPTDVPPAVDGTHCCRPVRREPDAVFLGTDKVPREVMRVATQKVQYPYSTIEIQPRGL